MYQDVVLQAATGNRFFVEPPSKLWDTHDLSQPVMSDCGRERRTNQEFIRRASGDVLIFGLGIGLVVLAIQDKPDVDSVTIVELHKEVVDLVAPQIALNEKVGIEIGSVFDYRTEKMYDTIWIDIWTAPDESRELQRSGVSQDREKLQQKFARNLRPNGWIGSWHA